MTGFLIAGAVLVAFCVLGTVIYKGVLRRTFVDEEVGVDSDHAVHVRYNPPAWLPRRAPSWGRLSSAQKALMSDFLLAYVEKMPAAFTAVGVPVSTRAMLEALSGMSCKFTEGPLRSLVREHYGLDDVNKDGRSDRYRGLAHGEDAIEVGVLPEDIVNGEIQSADVFRYFAYEFNNAMIMRFLGHDVSFAEAFVALDDPKVIAWVGTEVAKAKSRRRVIDLARQVIVSDLLKRV